MASITENISVVRQHIDQSARASSRSPGNVLLLAVSKTQGPDQVRQAFDAGQRDFGENYVQEALAKIAALSLPDIRWHFIGPIQSNKTREIAEHFDWVHSVDRIKIAERLSAQRPVGKSPLNVCVQVNVSAEDSKSGVVLAEVDAVCAAISQLNNLNLRGLMAIPAPCGNYEQQRLVFRPLAELLHSLKAQHPTLDTLSIGMSADFDAAIAEGSTIIRVGSAIFGARN